MGRQKSSVRSLPRGRFGLNKLQRLFPDNDDPLRSITLKALEYVRKILKKIEPFRVSDIPSQKVRGDKINMIVKIINLHISQAHTFEVKQVKTNTVKMYTNFVVWIPVLQLTGGFTIKGKDHEINIDLMGSFRVNLKEIEITSSGNVGIVEEHARLKNINVNYKIGGIETGDVIMKGVGLQPFEIEHLLTHVFDVYLKKNTKLISFLLGLHATNYANNLMKARTVRKFVKWLSTSLEANELQ